MCCNDLLPIFMHVYSMLHVALKGNHALIHCQHCASFHSIFAGGAAKKQKKKGKQLCTWSAGQDCKHIYIHHTTTVLVLFRLVSTEMLEGDFTLVPTLNIKRSQLTCGCTRLQELEYFCMLQSTQQSSCCWQRAYTNFVLKCKELTPHVTAQYRMRRHSTECDGTVQNPTAQYRINTECNGTVQNATAQYRMRRHSTELTPNATEQYIMRRHST